MLTAIAILGVLGAPLIARLYATRLDGDIALRQQEVLTFLLRFFIPQVIFYGLAAITAGLLNAHKRFGSPMFTPVLNNLVVIAVFLAFRQAYQNVTLENVTTSQLMLIGLGTTAGVALMAVAQLPFLRGLGRYRWTFSIAHPSVRKLARLSVFVVGYVVANQVGYIVAQWLANDQQGGYSAYTFAFVFFMLPHGLFAVSVITALLPGMSQAAVNAQWDDFKQRLSTGIRATMLLVLPAAVGYLVLADPIIKLILERGVFGPRSTELVAGVLRIFVFGLVPFSLFQLFLRAFYSVQDTRTPFLINLGCVGLNIAVNVPMYAVFQVRGLALGHAVAYSAGAIGLGAALARKVGGLDLRALGLASIRIAAAAAAMGAIVWGLLVALERTVGSGDLMRQAVIVLVPSAVGAAAYLFFARLFRVRELEFIGRALAGRFGRG